jgi:hypothetical protein
MSVAVLFARPYPGWEKDAGTALELGFQALDAAGRAFQSGSNPLSKKEKNMLRLSARSVIRAGWKLRAYATHVRRIVGHLRPAAILLPEENIEYLSHVLTRQSAALGVPSLILPYTLDNPLEACEAYHQHPRHRVAGMARQWFAARHPHWVRLHGGVALFRLPFRAAWAMQQLGYAPRIRGRIPAPLRARWCSKALLRPVPTVHSAFQGKKWSLSDRRSMMRWQPS